MKTILTPKIIPDHNRSKFIFDAHNMKLYWGKVPTKEGQLWKGEDMDGNKMEINGDGVHFWGWSN